MPSSLGPLPSPRPIRSSGDFKRRSGPGETFNTYIWYRALRGAPSPDKGGELSACHHLALGPSYITHAWQGASSAGKSGGCLVKSRHSSWILLLLLRRRRRSIPVFSLQAGSTVSSSSSFPPAYRGNQMFSQMLKTGFVSFLDIF